MNFSAVLLAGGESHRMGRDKATIVFQEKLLWQHQLAILRQLRPKEIFVSARQDPLWRPNDIEFVADDPPSRGPLSGLAATLGKISTSHLLALAVDMPFVPIDFLAPLCRGVEPERGYIPIRGDRLEPLCAIYPREVSADFDKALLGDDFSLQKVCGALVLASRLILVNMPKDYEKHLRSLNEPGDLPN